MTSSSICSIPSCAATAAATTFWLGWAPPLQLLRRGLCDSDDPGATVQLRVNLMEAGFKVVKVANISERDRRSAT